MTTPPQTRATPSLLLTWTLAALVAMYGYAVVAYAFTTAEYFPEQSPPLWSWPAVFVVGIGYVVAVPALLLAAVRLFGRGRLDTRRRRPLAIAGIAGLVMVLTMASPYGWAIFDWYVG